MTLSLLNKISPSPIRGFASAIVSASVKYKRSIFDVNKAGSAILVGAGPGDPELLTLKALKAFEYADVVLFDSLVSEEILKSGIPLTHRDCAQSVRFVTATMKDAKQQPQWANLADVLSYQTLVFYMGLSRLNMICTELVQHGADKNTSIALVENASCTNQHVIAGTLDTIGAKMNSENLQGPTLIIVGDVVQKRSQISDLNVLLAAKLGR